MRLVSSKSEQYGEGTAEESTRNSFSHSLNKMLGTEARHTSSSAALLTGKEWLNMCHTLDNAS